MHMVDILIVPYIIYCYCVLHNFMLNREDVVSEELPLVGHHYMEVSQFRNQRVILDKALAIGNAIVEHL